LGLRAHLPSAGTGATCWQIDATAGSPASTREQMSVNEQNMDSSVAIAKVGDDSAPGNTQVCLAEIQELACISGDVEVLRFLDQLSEPRHIRRPSRRDRIVHLLLDVVDGVLEVLCPK